MTEQTLGKYIIVRALGSGGMADVFLARDPMLDRNLAIKVIHSNLASDPEFEQRFRREARLVASLRHPNIVQVFDYDLSNSGPFMVMEFLDGGALKYKVSEYTKRGETMPLEEASAYITAIASGLDHAHGRNLVHRDLKPSNILFTSKGDPVITDFGIAKILGDASEMTMTGQVLGTPAYMSPEQSSGKPIDKRSDIYSLGVMLYEMVTGRVPFKGESTTAVMMQHLTQPPPFPRTLNPKLSQAVEDVVVKALAKNPNERFASAGHLARAFSEALRAESKPAEDDQATMVDAGAATMIMGEDGTLVRPGAPAAAPSPASNSANRPRPAPRVPEPGVASDLAPAAAVAPAASGAASPGVVAPATSPSGGAPSRPLTVSVPRIETRVIAAGLVALVLLIGAAAFGIGRMGSSAQVNSVSGGVASLPQGAGDAPTRPAASGSSQKGTPVPAASGEQKATPSPGGAMAGMPGMNTPPAGGESYGFVRFADGSAEIDQVLVTLTGVDQPGPGKRYEAWLVGRGGESRVSLGKVDLDAKGNGNLTYVDKNGTDLLSEYGQFELTIEPDPDPSPLPSGTVAYSSGIPDGALMHIGHLLVAFDDTPNKVGYTLGLIDDARLVKQMTDDMLQANQKNDFENVLIQAESLVNLIEGKEGQHYGDLDKNGAVSDESDGYGLLLNGKQNGYIEGTIDHAKLAAGSKDATQMIKSHAEHVTVAAKNIDEWSTQLRDLCLKILASSDSKSVQQEIRTSIALGDRILNGVDLDGDESVDPVPGEAGARTLYQHALYMADMPVLKGANLVPTPAP